MRGKIRFSILFGGKGWLTFWPIMRPEWEPFPEEVIMELKKEKCVRKLADAGVNLIWTDFSCGRGPAEEREAREEAKGFVKLCHRYGIGVLLYLQLGNVHWGPFYKEFPEAPDWIARDPQGRPVYYNNGNYWFRYHMCLNNPNWVKYLKDVIREILVDAAADGICIDNIFIPPDTCYCPLCKRKFIDYLKDKYSPSKLTQELGFESFDEIEPPAKFVGSLERRYMQTFPDTKDKLTREWIRFKADYLTDLLKKLADHARSLKSDAIVTGNTWSIALENKIANCSIDLPAIEKIFDMLYVEGIVYPRVEFLLGSSYMISSIREYKFGLACAKDKPVVVEPTLPRRGRTPQVYVTPSPSQAKLVIAEGLACGGYGVVAFSHEDTIITTEETSDVLEAVSSYNRWMKDHQDLFTDIESAANVALLRSLSSLTWDWEDAAPSLTDMEQILIQAHIPYDVILEENLKEELKNYDLLILPNVTCLSDENIGVIKTFVKKGKGLLATEDSLRYDENFQPRKKDPWREMLGDFSRKEGVIKATYKKGKVVFCPRRPSSTKMLNFGYVTGNWYLLEFPKLPDRWEEMVENIKWAAGELPLEIKGPKTVFVHLWRQQEPQRYLLHLVNYRQQNPVRDIDVKMRIPDGLKPTGVSLLSPDLAGPLSLQGDYDGKHLSFHIPRLEIYDVVLIDLAP